MTVSSIDAFSTATALLAALRARSISSVELLDLHLRRIARYNPPLNAIVTFNLEEAQAQARAADSCRARESYTKEHEGLLLGLPMTIKDCIYLKGLTTTGGLLERVGIVDEEDAPIAAAVRAAGAVIMGKTNAPTNADDFQTDNPVFGRTNNPWNLELTPGGSTGGGAAALAAGLTPLELGGDFMGSIRIPAAFCGVYGHRPSLTAIPRSGHFPGGLLPNPANVLAVVGPLARAAEDLELALDTAAGPQVGEDVAWRVQIPAARQARLTDYRVAIFPQVDWLPVDVEIGQALTDLVSGLRRLGARVEYAQPDSFGDMREYYKLFLTFMGAGDAGKYLPEKRRRVAERLLGGADEVLVAYAEGIIGGAPDMFGWLTERERYREAYRRFFGEWDVLLSPTNIVNAFAHTAIPFSQRRLDVNGESAPYGRMSFYAGLSSMTGQPATAFPVGRTQSGVPIGLQAVGPYLEDRTPIAFAGLVGREFGGFVPPPGYDTVW